jgi:hypothetical protein
MKIEKRSCFDGGLESRKSSFLDELEELRVKGFCSRERIGGSWVSHLFSLLIHEADGIVFELTLQPTNYLLDKVFTTLSFWIGVVKRGFFWVMDKTASSMITKRCLGGCNILWLSYQWKPRKISRGVEQAAM